MKRTLFFLLLFPIFLFGQNFISKLDSLRVNNDNNTEIFAIHFIYNSYQNVQSILGYERTNPGGILIIRNDFIYNQSQQLISDIRINEFNINEFKKEYTYNSNGQLILLEEFTWEVLTGTWYGGPKNEWVFDQNNNLITEIKYDVLFSPTEKINYIYLNNNCISKLVSEMGPIGWEKNDSLINYYANNNLLASVEYYNATLSIPPSWQSKDSLEYTYGINGNTTTITSYSSIGFNNSWQLTNKEQLSYDLNGNRVQSIRINCSITPWDTASISEYSYDINNNMLYYNYYNAGNCLHNETRIYNSSLMNTTAFPEILDENEEIPLLSNNQIIERQLYFGNGANSIEYYYYSDFTPNNVVDKSHLDTRNLLTNIDLSGRKTKGKKNQPLFYIYDDGTVEKRIVIE